MSLPSRACEDVGVPVSYPSSNNPHGCFNPETSHARGYFVIGGVSRTLANREVQMGSMSTPAALMTVCSLSACYIIKNQMSAGTPSLVGSDLRQSRKFGDCSYGDLNTLIGEDEGGVGRCQLSGRHFEMY